MRAAIGPAQAVVKSSTRMPASGARAGGGDALRLLRHFARSYRRACAAAPGSGAPA
jgi:hypothetical protein